MGVGKGVISKRMGLITTGTLLGWLYIAYHGLKKNFKNDGFLDCGPKSLQLHPGEKGNIKIVKKSHRAHLSWFSSNEEIASVDSHGNITAHKKGHTFIYAQLDENKEYNAVSEALEVYVKQLDIIAISILGMPGAGKTTLLRFLQGRPERNEEFVTPDEGVDYDEYTYIKENGIKVKIAAGRDISGIEYIQKEYPPLINKSDLILFLFSLERYIVDLKEKAEIQSRLDFLFANLKGKRLIVFMTYKERFGENDLIRDTEAKKAYRSYKQEISTKVYAKILDYPHHIISLKYGEDKSELKKIFDNLL